MNVKRWIVLLLAIGQIVASAFGGFQGQGTFSTPIITPAGYAFSIWGVITLGCLLYGVYQLLPGQRKEKLYDRLALPLIFVFSGFSVWIYVAAREILWMTVVVFLVMLVALVAAYRRIGESKKKLSAFESVIIRGTLGMYTGWAAVAFVLNIATALFYYHVIQAGDQSLFVYMVVLVVALGNAMWIFGKLDLNYYYVLIIIWAM
jgi:hypothetical protein